MRTLRPWTQLLALAVVATGCPPPPPPPPPPPSHSDCVPPYQATSAFNVPIAKPAAYAPNSSALVATMNPDGGAKLTSDPTQYTMPVFYVTSQTPLVTVTYSGWYSEVSNGGSTLNTYRFSGDLTKQKVDVPVPPSAVPGDGNDQNIIILNLDNGDEWNLNTFEQDSKGVTATNVGRYNTAWSGVPPAQSVNNGNPYWNNGAGVPLLGGLVRPCELQQGRIEHALSFAYPDPTPQFIFPATKSDGTTPVGFGMPEGTRLQLDPSISDATIRGWGCTDSCFTIAQALQEFGMYLLNGSGRPKLMVEDESTARWGGLVSSTTPSPIPLDRFKVVAVGS